MAPISMPMFRPSWGKRNEDDESQQMTYPDPILVRADKYWVLGGSLIARSDPREEIDVKSINLVQYVESARTWEHLKIPIFCSICTDHQRIPFLDQFHWKYLNCAACVSFFVCGKCVESNSAAAVRQLRSHREHGDLVVIQTRPFSRPLHDGSDLEHMKLFKTVNTVDQFFLYFPWFFHSFAGMDELRNLLREAYLKEAKRKLALPGANRSMLEDMIRLYDLPVDWFLRAYSGGNWRRLHRSLQGMITERIQVAKSSAILYKLLLWLQGFVKRKEDRYGTSDIPAGALIINREKEAASVFGTFHHFVAYLWPLHGQTSQNAMINRTELQGILRSKSYRGPLEATTAGGVMLASACEAGYLMEGSTSHLSNPFGPEFQRLWPMFKLLFKDDPEYSSLVSGKHTDMNPFVLHAFPEWTPMLDRDSKIREGLWKLQYQSMSESVEYFTVSTEPQYTMPDDLLDCRRRRMIGDYEDAMLGLQIINARYIGQNRPNAEVILELQLTFLEQGYYRKAMTCISQLGLVVFRGPNDVQTLMFLLVTLISTYARLFVECKWDEALTSAMNMFSLISDGDEGENCPRSLDHILLRIRIEIIFHRIVLETYRDLGRSVPKEAALRRLENVRRFLAQYPNDPTVAEVAWDTLSVELEMRKRSVRAQYMEIEAAHSMVGFLHTAAKVIPLVNRFKTTIRGRDPISCTVRGRVELLQAELLVDIKHTRRLAVQFAQAAEESFRMARSDVGKLDVQLFHATSREPIQHVEILPIYESLRARNDIARCRNLRILRLPMPRTEDGSEAWWAFRQRATLRELAEEAGDTIAFYRWELRKYAADTMAGASLRPAETVLTSSTVHSVVLATLASFNLSKAYATLGNYLAASLNAMLHLSLAVVQDDAETHQRAILNVLHLFSETVAAEPARFHERLVGLSEHWKAFLDDATIHRWYQGNARCDELERFIEGALFLPLLSGRVERDPSNGILPHDDGFEAALAQDLKLACDLYETMPIYNAHAIIPKLSLGLGGAAAYVGNSELAIRCYWEGLVSCHSGDLFSRACLQLEAGKLMTTLGERDPENWMHGVAPGRSLLDAASKAFFRMPLSGSMLKGVEANMYLLRSFVSEARARKRVLDVVGEDEIDGVYLASSLELLVQLVEKAKLPLGVNEQAFGYLAQFVNLDSGFNSEYNLVRLAENLNFFETRQLALELGAILANIESLGGQQCGTNFWKLVQNFKGTVLNYRYGRLVPIRLLESIRSNPESWALYNEERELLDDGPQSMSDTRLTAHWRKMEECPELKPLMRRRLGKGASMTELSSLVKETVMTTQSVIMIDWIHYRGGFNIIGYNATTEDLCIFERIGSPSVDEVDAWVAQHIRVPDQLLVGTLDSISLFEPLHGLIEPIHRLCSSGDLLVFSPSQNLNSVPLHALPYRSADDREPLIQYHPVVYSPSNAVLRECVQRSLSMSLEGALRVQFFHCHPEGGNDGAKAIRDLADSLSSGVGAVTAITSDSAVTQATLAAQMPAADILHFHGHVSGQTLDKALVLAPETSLEAALETNVKESSPQGDEVEARTPLGRFTLQDAYAITLRARLVMLMGCASGVQLVSRGDDTLGLVSAFLAVGATSVVGTLWPLESEDVERFSREFYWDAFGVGVSGRANGEEASHDAGGAGGTRDEAATQLVDIARTVQRSVNSLRACTRPRCLKKSLDYRLRCHGVAPYHWAPFAVWGSWVCQRV